MYTRKRDWLGTVAVSVGCALMLAFVASAGVPKPGLILYGQVTDESGALLTEGELVWTFTPANGGGPVTVATALEAISGPDESYSYRALVPLESEEPGFPTNGGAVPVGSVSAEFVQEGQLLNTSIQVSNTVSFSTADISSVKRVDVCVTCDPGLTLFHSADIDDNRRFSLGELLRAMELHTATETHEYHRDPTTEDGFAAGIGPNDGDPHTGDYYGGADWHMTVHELVRMIDLFASTPEHAYSPEASSEDGFKKGWDDAPAAKGNSLKATPEAIVMQRLVQGGAVGAGGALKVTVAVEDFGGDPLSAMGVMQNLPNGWRYAGAEKANGPAAAPALDASDRLEFAWFPVPKLPYTFTYEVTLPPIGNVERNFYWFQGEGIYRTVSGNAQMTVPFGAMPEDGVLDTDGDGIPDLVESGADSDGDRVPDLIDVDSDNDGLSDAYEAGFDRNGGDYDPYDPVFNPDGADLNATQADTDGDGVSDNEEIAQGSNPLMETDGAATVPATGSLALLLLVAGLALGMGGVLRARKVHARVR